jgi:hypothetical protein
MKLVISWILSHWEAVIIPLSIILYEIIARKQPTENTYSIIEKIYQILSFIFPSDVIESNKKKIVKKIQKRAKKK